MRKMKSVQIVEGIEPQELSTVLACPHQLAVDIVRCFTRYANADQQELTGASISLYRYQHLNRSDLNTRVISTIHKFIRHFTVITQETPDMNKENYMKSITARKDLRWSVGGR